MTEGQLTLQFLGTGDAFGSGGRANTCMRVTAAARAFLIDCGATSLPVMRAAGVEPSGIDTILVSHLHGDHFGALPFLLLDAAFAPPRPGPLRIAGPRGIEARVFDTLDLLFPGTRERVAASVAPRFVELEPERSTDLDGIVVTPHRVSHGSTLTEACALRIEVAGRVLTYSGDTEWTPSLIEASRDADLFVCECFGYEREVPGHLSWRRLERERGSLSARRIVLTHFGPEMLAHLADVPVPCAHDGLVIQL